MKAAVLHAIGDTPRYQEFPDPEPGEGEVVIEVKAVAVENLDGEISAGRHFSGQAFAAALPAIPCLDGVEIYGSSKGLTAETMRAAYEEVLQWTRAAELAFGIERVALGQIEAAWHRTDLAGRRLVVVPG